MIIKDLPFRHGIKRIAPIFSLDFQSHLTTGGGDGFIIIWSDPPQVYCDHLGAVLCVRYKDKYMAASYDDGFIVVYYQLKNEKEKREAYKEVGQSKIGHSNEFDISQSNLDINQPGLSTINQSKFYSKELDINAINQSKLDNKEPELNVEKLNSKNIKKDSKFMQSINEDSQSFIDLTSRIKYHTSNTQTYDYILYCKINTHKSDVCYLEWHNEYLISISHLGLIAFHKAPSFKLEKIVKHSLNITGLLVTCNYLVIQGPAKIKILPFNYEIDTYNSKEYFFNRMDYLDKYFITGICKHNSNHCANIYNCFGELKQSFVGHVAPTEVVLFGHRKVNGCNLIAISSQDRSLSLWLDKDTKPFLLLKNLTDTPVLDMKFINDSLYLCTYSGKLIEILFDKDFFGQKVSRSICNSGCILKDLSLFKSEDLQPNDFNNSVEVNLSNASTNPLITECVGSSLILSNTPTESISNINSPNNTVNKSVSKRNKINFNNQEKCIVPDKDIMSDNSNIPDKSIKQVKVVNKQDKDIKQVKTKNKQGKFKKQETVNIKKDIDNYWEYNNITKLVTIISPSFTIYSPNFNSIIYNSRFIILIEYTNNYILKIYRNTKLAHEYLFFNEFSTSISNKLLLLQFSSNFIIINLINNKNYSGQGTNLLIKNNLIIYRNNTNKYYFNSNKNIFTIKKKFKFENIKWFIENEEYKFIKRTIKIEIRILGIESVIKMMNDIGIFKIAKDNSRLRWVIERCIYTT